MKKKCLILCTAFLVSVAAGLSQDTSKLSTGKQLKNNSNTLNAAVYPDSGIVNKKGKTGAAHTSVNPNSGTKIPSTTSGTLNSTVNPNTQLVIPIRKTKKKPNPNIIHDSRIINPK
jgi:hypothetical protein